MNNQKSMNLCIDVYAWSARIHTVDDERFHTHKFSKSIPLKKGAVIDLSHLSLGSKFRIKKVTKDYVLVNVKGSSIVRSFKGLEGNDIFDNSPLPYVELFKSHKCRNLGFKQIVVTTKPICYSTVSFDTVMTYRIYLQSEALV